MSYIDGFVCAAPTANREVYRKYAADAAAIFRDHGATQVVECWGDDVPEGKLTSLPMAVKCEPGETVVAGWVLWPDKAARDAGWKTAMEDPEMQGGMPFDGKRMIFGGFEMLAQS
jgi:uncharacterized protein YbaA (DUF1428 family)